MLDEEMDDIIRNAATRHHPGYNDEAWEKMEAQLDKHLPQKKDRRKFIFFLLFFLLLGGAALLTVINFTGNKNADSSKLADNKTVEKSAAGNSASTTVPPGQKTITAKEESGNSTGSDQTRLQPATTVNEDPVNNAGQDNKNIAVTDELQGKTRKKSISRKGKTNMSITAAGLFEENMVGSGNKKKPSVSKTRNSADRTNITIISASPEEKAEDKEDAVSAIAKIEEQKTVAIEKENAKPGQDKEVKEKQKETTAVKPVSPEKKKKKNPFSNFGITASAGPDMSFVKLSNTGKTTLNYGAGLSYNFAKRFTARAGFYVSKKIYSATPEQYTNSGPVYPYLDMIDADCKIYEIPVGISYDIVQRKKYNLFGGVAVSSYLMKSEDYDYNYKLPSGQTYTYKTGVKNENKHYFSVLTLSAGYQYKISKRVSVQAEPYMKLPLGGIGIGQIKLNSAGILFTATVKPFAKKN